MGLKKPNTKVFEKKFPRGQKKVCCWMLLGFRGLKNRFFKNKYIENNFVTVRLVIEANKSTEKPKVEELL